MVATSQIVQNLPLRDRRAWKVDVTEGPESEAERFERSLRERSRWQGLGPNSVWWAEQWAAVRLAARP